MRALETAIKLREEGKFTESNALLIDLSTMYPNDANINYQCAWSFDVLGMEQEAVPYYEKAIILGLPDEDMQGAFLGLGSTYRTLGDYEKSRQIFEKGIDKFPEDRALKVFYAMTLYNLKAHSMAMEILLMNLAQTSSDRRINEYKRALEFYSDKLDQVW